MSFILDALKKSDAKRRAGQAPELSAAWAPPSPQRRAVPWGWLVGPLVIASIAMGGWLVFQLGSRSGNNVGATAVVTDKSNADQDDALNPSRREAMSLAQQIQASRNKSSYQAVAKDAAPVTATEALSAAADLSDVSGSIEAQANQVVAMPTDDDRARANALATLPMPDEAVVDQPIEPALEEAAVPDEQDWTPDASDFLYVWELPLDIRQNLPQLKLNVLVFAPKPEDRFVLINGRRMREGQSFYDGRLRLVEIRAEGVLIDHQDYRFLLTQ